MGDRIFAGNILAYLGKRKRWDEYLTFYPDDDKSTLRRCYYALALIHSGHNQKAYDALKPLWLSTKNSPKPCNQAFSLWRASASFDKNLIWQRFEWLMHKKQYNAAKTVLALLPEVDILAARHFIKVALNPHNIKHLEKLSHREKGAIYAYGLKRLAKRSPDKTLIQLKNIETHTDINHEDRESVMQTIALYKALRNHADAAAIFEQLDKNLLSELHQSWHVRIALKKHDFAAAAALIESFTENVKEKPMWQYWLARSYEQTGREIKAQTIYKRLSKKRQYYGFLASHRIERKVSLEPGNYSDNKSLLDKHKNQINYIKKLYKSNNKHKASLLSYELSNDLSKEAQHELAREFSRWQWHDKALHLANASGFKDDLDLRFPLAYRELITHFSEKYHVDKPLVYAIIRQESTFRKGVKSHAGALGLMQVIPSTARKIAKKNKIPLKNMKQMYQPKTNVHIGTAYLRHLGKRFDHHPVLVAAAYNAGPRQVKRWLKNHPQKDVDLWIETIPWYETRNYLKNILSFYAVYQSRLNLEPNINNFMREL